MDPLSYNEKKTIFINESGLYSLILSSKLKMAKKFKRWVTKDVLPTIRKTGSYKLQEIPDEGYRRLTLAENAQRVEELKLLKELMDDCDDIKLTTVLKDSLMNKLCPNQKLIKQEDKWARDITDICRDEFGFTPNHSMKIKIGKLLKNEYVDEFDKNPPKYEKWVNGNKRKVNAYLKNDEEWIIDTIRNSEYVDDSD
jgi:hypothetical protein